MNAEHHTPPIVHFVGSIPLPDTETVFRTLSSAVGGHVARLPDGETGIRKTWIRFLQDVLAQNPAIEFATDVPPFRFVQWDGKLVREIPRLRIKPGMTPIAPTYNTMVPGDRPKLLPPLTQHFLGEVDAIAAALPNDRIAIQWDVCQEVLAWEGYYEPGPVDFHTETVDVLGQIGDAVPSKIELGYHLCYGSPADEHMVQPKDAGIMVEIVNGIVGRVKRGIDFFHLPVPKGRTDDAYFAPLKKLKLRPGTALYLGLIHHSDAAGDKARLAAARRHTRVDGIGTECGMARGDPARLPALLAAHAHAAKLAD